MADKRFFEHVVIAEAGKELCWLGVLDLGLDAAGRLQAIRLTPFGKELIGSKRGELAGDGVRVLS